MDLLVAILAYFVIFPFISGTFLYLAGKITGTDCYYLGMVLVVAVSNIFLFLVSIISLNYQADLLFWIGFAGSIWVFIAMLKRLTRAQFFPDLCLMLLVYFLTTILIVLF